MNSLNLVLSLFLLVLITGIIGDDLMPVEVVKPSGNSTQRIVGIKYQDNICVLTSFDQANISIIVNGTENVHSIIVTNFEDWQVDPDKSSCGSANQTQMLTMINDNNYLKFEFKLQNSQKKDTEKGYSLSQMTYEWSNRDSTNGTIKKDTVMSYMKPDLKPKGSLVRGYAFECKHRYKFILNNTDSIYETRILISGLKFSAFRNSTSDKYTENRVFCDITKKASPGNDIIPIAVGGVLTGILVVSLVGYLVIRARKS